MSIHTFVQLFIHLLVLLNASRCQTLQQVLGIEGSSRPSKSQGAARQEMPPLMPQEEMEAPNVDWIVERSRVVSGGNII